MCALSCFEQRLLRRCQARAHACLRRAQSYHFIGVQCRALGGPDTVKRVTKMAPTLQNQYETVLADTRLRRTLFAFAGAASFVAGTGVVLGEAILLIGRRAPADVT